MNDIIHESWLRLTMGHLGSRVIASEMLGRVNNEDQIALHVNLPREAIRMGTGRNSRVHEDSKTNRAFFVILHSLEEEAL